MLRGRGINSHSKNAVQSAGSSPGFFLTLRIKPSLVESSVSLYSVFKQGVPERSWRCETPTRICRGPNYSPATVLASTGSHSQHCSPPGSFWSSISLAWLMLIIAMQLQWWARHPGEVGIPEALLVLSIRLAHKTPWAKSLGRSHHFIKLQSSSLGSQSYSSYM